MLDDREQRVLDATEAVLGREEPELAARLRGHSLAATHRVPARRPESARPAQRARGLRRVPPAVWPPLVMFALCLVLVILPVVLA